MQTKYVLLLLGICFLSLATQAQQASPESVPRIPFTLKNTLGYHRMFRVEGPGIAYGFTMNKRESVACNWPVGSKLYFSQDGETTAGLILTVTAADAGETLGIDVKDTKPKVTKPTGEPTNVTVLLRNNSFLPRRIALITYRPDEAGNGTTIAILWPLGVRKVNVPPGTKLYIANPKQVDLVMSGKRIDQHKPFLTVRQADNFHIFDIFE